MTFVVVARTILQSFQTAPRTWFYDFSSFENSMTENTEQKKEREKERKRKGGRERKNKLCSIENANMPFLDRSLFAYSRTSCAQLCERTERVKSLSTLSESSCRYRCDSIFYFIFKTTPTLH